MPRNPLPWLIALELVVVAALGFLGWRVVSDRLAAPAAPTVVMTTPSPGSPAPSRQAAAPAPRSPMATVAPKSPVLPGLSTDGRFWQEQLTQVNRDQAAWETAEWRVVQVVEGFARSYVEHVVLPAVQAAASRRS